VLLVTSWGIHIHREWRRTVCPEFALEDALQSKIGRACLASHRPAVVADIAVALVRPLLHGALRPFMLLLHFLGDHIPLASKAMRGAARETLVAYRVTVEGRIADRGDGDARRQLHL
jgi:hypothetical protein